MTYKISYSVAALSMLLHANMCLYRDTVYGENSKKTNMGKRMSLM